MNQALGECSRSGERKKLHYQDLLICIGLPKQFGKSFIPLFLANGWGSSYTVEPVTLAELVMLSEYSD